MIDAFISYSRRDKGFVRKLHATLVNLERDIWVDWESLSGLSNRGCNWLHDYLKTNPNLRPGDRHLWDSLLILTANSHCETWHSCARIVQEFRGLRPSADECRRHAGEGSASPR
jgi:hypothetical protein